VRGSVVSRSRVEGGRYWATFRVDRLLYSKELDMQTKFLRLELSNKPVESGGSGECSIWAKVKPNNKYLLMVKKQGEQKAGIFASTDQFFLSSSPLKSNKKLMRAVRSILTGEGERQKVRVRRGKVQQVVEESPSGESKPKVRQTTRLSCSARGNPPPTLYWTIDGRVIENKPNTRIITKNLSKFLRKSVLKLKGSVQKSSVHLQCHAFNSYGHTSKVKLGKMRTSAPRQARVTTSAPRRRKTGRRIQDAQLRAFRTKSSSLQGAGSSFGSGLPISPLRSSSCPIQDFCMNGGTCHFYSTLGEQTCQCAKGYRGRRCERKYVSTGSLGPRMSDKFPLCLLGMAHYPCQ